MNFRSGLPVLITTIAGSLAMIGCGSGASSAAGAGGGVATGGISGGGGTSGAAGSGSIGGGGGGEGGVGGEGGLAAGGRTGAAGSLGTGGMGGSATGGSGAGGPAAGGGGHAGGSGTAGVGGAAGHAGGSGTAGAAGLGGAGMAGSGGQAGAGGAAGLGPEAPGGRISGYGTVLISANAKNQIVRLQTTMVVPPEPPASGTLFLWPGLDPDGANFDPINNGVLQPVLTWGDSCAPVTQPRAYSTWWISGQYVNTNGAQPGYIGCYSGAAMSVNVGDTLNMDIALSGTVWNQTVTDVQTNKAVTYSIDMMDQSQNLAYFVIEEYSSAPVSEVIFTNSTITFGSADAADCKLNMRGQNDFVSVPVASSDGLRCSIEEIILRAQGIP